MINFRYHLVSLVAVFLALALGVMMGSTVIDRAIVDGLKARIKTVGDRADRTRDENLALKDRLDALEGFAEASVPHIVGQRLADVPVAMVAIRGVDDGVVRQTAEVLREGGAILPGVVWLEPALNVPDTETEVKLGQALGDQILKGDELRLAAVEALGRRLAAGPDPAGGVADLLVDLGGAGFVAFDGLGGDFDPVQFPPPGSRVLIANGPEGSLPTEVIVLPMVRSLLAGGAMVAMGEVFAQTDSGPDRGSVVSSVRDDSELAGRVATVDNLEEPRGRAALALALEELGRGLAGHYGHGPGASRQLPEPVHPAPRS